MRTLITLSLVLVAQVAWADHESEIRDAEAQAKNDCDTFMDGWKGTGTFTMSRWWPIKDDVLTVTLDHSDNLTIKSNFGSYNDFSIKGRDAGEQAYTSSDGKKGPLYDCGKNPWSGSYSAQVADPITIGPEKVGGLLNGTKVPKEFGVLIDKLDYAMKNGDHGGDAAPILKCVALKLKAYSKRCGLDE